MCVEWLCLCCLHGIMWCVLSGCVSAVFMGSCGVCWVALSLLSSWDHVVCVEWLCLCCLHGIMWCVLGGSVSAVFMGSCGVC